MIKIFIDTNLWVRFFIKDNQAQFEQTQKILAQIEEGTFRAYTSTIVLLELQFVLQKLYHLSFDKTIEVFEIVKNIRNITIIEKTNLEGAIYFLKQYRIKFPDCLIASQLPKNTTLVSFDEELFKIKEITVKTPRHF